MKKYQILFIVILLQLMACSKKEPLEPEGASGIMPLSVGNKWTYLYTNYDDDGVGIDTTLYIYMKIAKAVAYGNEAWYEVSTEIGDYTSYTYYTNYSDGLWIKVNDSISLCYIKYPCPLGDSYSFLGYQVQLVAVGVPVPVDLPAGDFSCYCYAMYDTSYSAEVNYAYYKYGLGLVKCEITENRIKKVTWELIDYSLK